MLSILRDIRLIALALFFSFRCFRLKVPLLGKLDITLGSKRPRAVNSSTADGGRGVAGGTAIRTLIGVPLLASHQQPAGSSTLGHAISAPTHRITPLTNAVYALRRRRIIESIFITDVSIRGARDTSKTRRNHRAYADRFRRAEAVIRRTFLQ